METGWIGTIDFENFLAIYDVVLDIKQELNISADYVAIPLLPPVVRFRELMPADTIGMRDRYCEFRMKAVKFLTKKAVVRDSALRDGLHRWDSRLMLSVDESLLDQVHTLMAQEYGRRIPKEEAEQPSKMGRPDPRKVFVIHGRDENLRSGMFTFLRTLDLDPLEWTEAIALTGKTSPYVREILDAAFCHAQAIVVILSPDDEARLREALWGPSEAAHERNLTPQPRANVLFEAGMAMGRNPKRTILVEFGQLRPFSDIGGILTIRMDNSTQKRQALALRLRDAGCPIDLGGTDWQTAGDLTAPTIAPA